jgi:hypothetical protein
MPVSKEDIRKKLTGIIAKKLQVEGPPQVEEEQPAIKTKLETNLASNDLEEALNQMVAERNRMQQLAEVEEEGADAFSNGAQINDNPYMTGVNEDGEPEFSDDDLGVAWEAGYYSSAERTYLYSIANLALRLKLAEDSSAIEDICDVLFEEVAYFNEAFGIEEFFQGKESE